MKQEARVNITEYTRNQRERDQVTTPDPEMDNKRKKERKKEPLPQVITKENCSSLHPEAAHNLLVSQWHSKSPLPPLKLLPLL